jgi:phosphopantothenoylcysteine synthetase/decarboxylase
MTPTNAADGRRKGMLYVIACGAPPASELPELVGLAQADGWDVAVIATPTGSRFFEVEAVAALTGRPVRVDWRLPDEADPFPPADVILVAPATLTTIAKFRHAIADTLAVGLLCEALGLGIPIVVAPNVKAVLTQHPAFEEHLASLRMWGVHLVEQEPTSRGQRLPPWENLVALLRTVAPDGGSRDSPS